MKLPIQLALGTCHCLSLGWIQSNHDQLFQSVLAGVPVSFPKLHFTVSLLQIFVQYKIAWHPAPVSRWKNDFMYTGKRCDFVVICICFCVWTPFSFFVVLLPLQKNKPNSPQIHRINTTHLTQGLPLKLTSQQIPSHTVFLILFQILPSSSNTPGNLYFSSLQILN